MSPCHPMPPGSALLRLLFLGCLPLFGGGAEPAANLQAPAKDNDGTPRLFTLKAKGIPLSQALHELAKQTDTSVEDRRNDKENDLKLDLDLTQVTFWQGLDRIAGEAGLRVSLYEKDVQIALRKGPPSTPPVS